MYIKEYKDFNNITEDKILKFSDYDATKYNGNELVIQIRNWLLNYVSPQVKHENELVTVENGSVTTSLQEFYRESGVDKNIFMTFYNEMEKTGRINNFDIEIDNMDNVVFKNFRNETIEENKETEK